MSKGKERFHMCGGHGVVSDVTIGTETQWELGTEHANSHNTCK